MDDRLSVHWDAIIVGTGLGGATVGARLAQAGMRVLFVERGRNRPGEGEATPLEQLEAEVIRDGADPVRVQTTVAAVGGTSLVYAASLERPERHDLDDLPDLPHPTGGWPVGHDGFAPFYDRIERMMGVAGEVDELGDADGRHLRPPPPLCPADAALALSMRRRGLHPYRTHVGINYQPGCAECIGRECLRGCKSDARNTMLSVALGTGRAAIAEGTIATRLLAERNRVTGIEARHAAGTARLTADRVLLGAGSLGSAQLMLASRSEIWPDGVGNRTGLVGRGVMFHLSERFALWAPRRAEMGLPAKSLALRDLYRRGGERYGVVQSMGLQADYGNILMHLYARFDGGRLRRLQPLRPLLRVPARIASLALGHARVFVGILEDLPYEQNRVETDDDVTGPPRITYSIAPELASRRSAFRQLIRTALDGERWFFLNQEPEINFGHACGTARFGTDPSRSVLDPGCRAHDLANLWVVDASFMPTSTGVNPGLTIAANGLRVAEGIIGKH